MFCGKCGKELQDETKFCPFCGTAIYQEENNIEERSIIEEETKETLFKSKIDKWKNKKVMWISSAAIVGVLAIVVLLGVFKSGSRSLLTNDSAEKYYNSYNMTSNVGVARNNKYIFYVGTNDSVIRMDADFGNRKTILHGKGIDIIYLVGETLYYHCANDYQVYVSDLNGENIQQITSMKNCWFSVVGETLYFLEGYYVWNSENQTSDPSGEFALYKSNLDGTECKKVIDGSIAYASIQDDNIVYFDTVNNVICVTDLNATNHRILHSNTSDHFVYEYKIYKNKLYYKIWDTTNANVSGIYSIELTTGNKEKIVSTIPGQFTFYKDSIIYGADTNSIYSATHICNLDGSNDQILSNDIFANPLVMGDYLYFYDQEPFGNIFVFDLKSKKSEAFETVRYNEMAFTNQYIFYIDSEDNNIYRCDHDGKNVIKLTDADCTYIYTYKDGLYYSGYANGYNSDNDETESGIRPYGLFKLDDNGENCHVVELNGHMSNYVFYKDYVYFPGRYDAYLYRTKIDNNDTDTRNKAFVRGVGDNYFGTVCFIENDWIYFSYWKASSSSSSVVARMSLDGDDTQTVIDAEASDLTIYDNKLYYLKRDDNDNWQLRKVNMDGTNDMLVLRADISEFEISDNKIYYIGNTDRNIYSINLDGTKRIQLTETACTNLSSFGNKIYYTDLYNQGYVFAMNFDGSGCKAIIKDNSKYTEKTDYKTQGVDAGVSVKEENTHVSFLATDIMSFKDPAFEEFLCEMFQKEKGTITGADLLSVQFFGYYEGSPDDISTLMNRGKYYYLFENSVLFSTESYPNGVEEIGVLCGDDGGDAEDYREGCTVVTVRSNEWMAEHVMPYLYYFKNMKHVAFGYCWVADNICVPTGVTWYGINSHDRYRHESYDPLYE